MKTRILSKENGTSLLLLVLSFGIYFFYYHHLILNLNTVLFNIEGDSLKNYYTFVYHIKNDKELLHFSGLNFPFGEHIVYTDCQPLLALLLKALPFTHPYLIGIMHGLILLSFIVTPLILNKIFLILKQNKFTAFVSSLAIALLSPQIHRLGGHFALAYGCIIPIGILFLLKYLKTPSNRNLLVLVLYNSVLFLIHPYFGLGLSLFCFVSILLNTLLNYKSNRPTVKKTLNLLAIGVLPIVLFKLFMLLTDTHHNRPDEPYGVDIMGAAANAESVFTPSFGPFTHFLKKFIKAEHVEWEALSYIGIFSLFFLICTVLMFPFYLMRIKMRTEITAIFAASVVFLFISFGGHISFLAFFDIEIATLNQFRAFGRFAWYFYFLLPVFLITLFANFTRTFSFKARKIILPLLAILFFSFNLLEAHYLLTSMTSNTFKSRNIFNENKLSDAEQRLITSIKDKNYQAIIPLPVFHIGSEVYQRNGDPSVAPAMIYSYHTGLPVLSVMLSRTSLYETETALEILNPYKKKRQILSLTKDAPFLIVSTGENLKEDESRLLKRLQKTHQLGEQSFYNASKNDFLISEKELSGFVSIGEKIGGKQKNVVFIASEKRKPFIDSEIGGYETIAKIDSAGADAGNYTVSFHYHLKEKKFRYIHNNLIVIKKNSHEDIWEYFTSVRSTSGFYDNFIVFEEKIKLDGHSRYEFMLHGPMKEKYRVSNFLLKPLDMNVKMNHGGMELYNNYPDQ
ncbi:MAG: hypothetical protein V4635_10955 [Bacteroidota bacterium]